MRTGGRTWISWDTSIGSRRRQPSGSILLPVRGFANRDGVSLAQSSEKRCFTTEIRLSGPGHQNGAYDLVMQMVVGWRRGFASSVARVAHKIVHSYARDSTNLATTLENCATSNGASLDLEKSADRRCVEKTAVLAELGSGIGLTNNEGTTRGRQGSNAFNQVGSRSDTKNIY
jgi:hypothetical protein